MAEIKLPELAESISEGEIAQWLKQIGDYVNKGEYIAEIETDKVNVEITSDYSGVLKKILKSAGDSVEVGEVIAVIDEEAQEGSVTSGNQEESKQEEPNEKIPALTDNEKASPNEVVKEEKEEKGTRPMASPAARKLARERGINLSEVVVTTDPLGRVRKHDIDSYKGKETLAEKIDIPMIEQPKTPVMDDEKIVDRMKMTRRRKTIAKRLVEVQQNAAMLTTFNEVDMSAILNLRKRRKDAFFTEHGVKLGFMSFFTKAVVGALKKYPLLNAEIQGDEILVKKYYDIGVAVSTDEGLVVPVVRNADRLDFAEIEKEISELANKARTNKLKINELQGGTFSITNGGIFGSLLSTPILNSPQVGILGMHTIQTRPVAIDEERMENRPMMYIALSYDHRIVDGKEAVSFLVKIKELLEDPETLLLNG